MWRSPSALRFLRRELSVEPGWRQWTDQHLHSPPIRHWAHLCSSASSSSGSGEGGGRDGGGAAEESMSVAEAKRLMRLVNVEEMKRRLGMEGEETIDYSKLLEVCEGMGVARNKEEAATFATVLDEAGIILLFRDQVYLHPNKVVDQVRKAVPLASTLDDDDPSHAELKKLQEKKGEIDMLAHKQVRRILWSGLGFFAVQVGFFFRLTFWEFSWDVMEPIAFFGSTAGILVGYAYFLFTSRDPTYQDLMKRLFLSRQRKLVQKKNFDMEKFMELQRHCKSSLDHHHAGAIGTTPKVP